MRIFITRNLASDSAFNTILTEAGFQVTGISLVKFIARPFQPIPDIDWLFFYSKNGVKFYFDQITTTNESFPKLAAMGTGTARMISERGYNVDFIGKGTPVEIAKAFSKVVKGQRIIFIRAENSKRSIQKALPSDTLASERIVYANYPIRNTAIPPHDVLVFTSPLNASTYFEYNSIAPNQQVYSLGPTTTEKLHELGIAAINTAPQPSEVSLANFILQKLKTTFF